MRLAPSTLSVIAAALSTQGIQSTHDDINNALASITGDTPVVNPLELQPGEFFLVDHEDDGMDTQHSVADLKEYLQDQAINTLDYFGRGSERTIGDFIKVYLCRRQLNIDSQAETVAKVTIN